MGVFCLFLNFSFFFNSYLADTSRNSYFLARNLSLLPSHSDIKILPSSLISLPSPALKPSRRVREDSDSTHNPGNFIMLDNFINSIESL